MAGLIDALKNSVASLRLLLLTRLSGLSPIKNPQIIVIRVIQNNTDRLFPIRGETVVDGNELMLFLAILKNFAFLELVKFF